MKTKLLIDDTCKMIDIFNETTEFIVISRTY